MKRKTLIREKKKEHGDDDDNNCIHKATCHLDIFILGDIQILMEESKASYHDKLVQFDSVAESKASFYHTVADSWSKTGHPELLASCFCHQSCVVMQI